jgi:3-phenylpropionate/trans-cinnamate dioxygenase ferredoxin subunit
MDEWHDAGAASELTEDTPVAARIGETEIGIYLVGDRCYAMENICPHAYALLSQGFVEGDEVECALHGARFHIPTGKCTQEPGGRDLVCYAVKREGERLLVKVD